MSLVGHFLDLMNRATVRLRREDWRRVEELGGGMAALETVVREAEGRRQVSERVEFARELSATLGTIDLPRFF